MFKITINNKEYCLYESIVCKEGNYFSILIDNKNNFAEEKFNLTINDYKDEMINSKHVDSIIKYLNDSELPLIDEENILYLYQISNFLLLIELQKNC